MFTINYKLELQNYVAPTQIKVSYHKEENCGEGRLGL